MQLRIHGSLAAIFVARLADPGVGVVVIGLLIPAWGPFALAALTSTSLGEGTEEVMLPFLRHLGLCCRGRCACVTLVLPRQPLLVLRTPVLPSCDPYGG